MARPNLKTHEHMLEYFADSVSSILNEIEINQKELKMSGRDNDQAKYFRTKKILKKWFFENGNRY